jgi:hypothetical protein
MGVEDQKITREESVIFNMEGLEGQDFIVRVPDSNTRGRTPQQKSRRISISVNKVAIPVSQIAHNPTISIVAYCLASISMTVTNKYCVSGPEWNMNFFLLAFQVSRFPDDRYRLIILTVRNLHTDHLCLQIVRDDKFSVSIFVHKSKKM